MEYLSENEKKRPFSSESFETEQREAEEGKKHIEIKKEIEENINPAIIDPLPSLPSKLTLLPMESENLIRQEKYI